MKTSSTLLTALFTLAGVAQSPAWAHAALETAAPTTNAQLSGAPKEVELRFNEALESHFSTIKVVAKLKPGGNITFVAHNAKGKLTAMNVTPVE